MTSAPPRAAEFIDRYLARETMQQIGDHYGVSRQRIH